MSALVKSLKCIGLVVFFALVAFLGTAEASSDEPSKSKKEQIREIESQLSAEKERLESVHTLESSLLKQLADMEEEVSIARRSLGEKRKALNLTRHEIERLEKQLAGAEARLRDAQNQMSKRVVALYKYARRGYINTLVKAKGLDIFRKRVKYIEAVMEEDFNTLSRLAEIEQKERKEISLIQREMADQETRRNEEERRVISLENDLEQKVIRLMKIHKEKEFYETAVKELQIAASELKKTFSEIEERGKEKPTFTSGFADAKGQLPFPLHGKVVKGDRFLGSTSGSMPAGIFIGGSKDNEVRAVFAGRVAYSGVVKGYGEVIIIDHGSRFFTISANLSERRKEEGDAVTQEEIIGRVGRGPSKGVKLYFEIRKAGNPLDPLEWLKEPS